MPPPKKVGVEMNGIQSLISMKIHLKNSFAQDIMINIKNINMVILNSSKARLKKEDKKMNKKMLSIN